MANPLVSNPNALVYGTDYVLEDILLYTPTLGGSLSIKDKMVELNYFEDIYNNTISGQVVLSDAIGLINAGSLNGNEFIHITIKKTGEDEAIINKNFRIFSITNRNVSVNNTFENYTINFCSEEFLLSEQYRISKGYTAQPISNIVQDIFDSFLKPQKSINIDPTDGLYDFVLPNKKIFETINWLSTYAQPLSGGTGTGKGTGADMIFFENSLGYFFTSLQNLYSQNSWASFSYNPKNINIEKNSNSTLEQEVYNVLKFEILDQFDTLSGISKGIFSNRLITIDPLLRIKRVTNFNYNKYFDSSTKMNSEALVNNYQNRYGKYLFDAPPDDMESGVLRLASSNSDQYNRAPAIKNNPAAVAHDIYIENYVPNRVAQIALSNYQRIKITVPGIPTATVGIPIDFNAYGISVNINKDTQRTPDPLLSGKYLITAVRHIVTNTDYITVMELAKESNVGRFSGVDNSDNSWSDVVKGSDA